MTEPSNYREVLMADCLGKCLKKCYRTILANHLEPLLLNSQFGGFKKRGIDFCSHTERCQIAKCKALKVSCALFFLDITQAFASLQRSIVSGPPKSDYDVFAVFTRLGLDPATYHEFAQAMGTPNACKQTHMSEGLSVLFHILADVTWFHMKGAESPTLYSNGSGAGSPLADVVFVFAMAIILRKCREKLTQEGLIDIVSSPLKPSCILPNGNSRGFYAYDCSYIDDCTFFVDHPNPYVLVDKVLNMIQLIADVFSSFALRLNFSVGKSEVMFDFRGKNSLEIRKEGIGIHGSQLAFSHGLADGTAHVLCVDMYKHMGCVLTRAHNCGREMAVLRQASLAAQAANAHMLRSKSQHATTKKLLIRTCLHTRQFLLAQLWDSFPARSWSLVRTTYVSQVRLACGLRYVDGCSLVDKEVLSKSGFIPIESHVRLMRLRYLRRLVLYAPHDLCCLVSWVHELSPKGSWLSLVLNDLRWLNSHTTLRFEDPEVDFGKWHAFIVGKNFLHFVRDAMRHPDAHEVHVSPKSPKSSPSEVTSENVCDVCNVVLPTFSQLCQHRFCKHKIKHPAFRYTYGAHCTACLKLFHTRPRLLHHWKSRAKNCFRLVMDNITPLSVEEASLLDKTDAETARIERVEGRPLRFAKVPAVKMRGPIPSWAVVSETDQ